VWPHRASNRATCDASNVTTQTPAGERRYCGGGIRFLTCEDLYKHVRIHA